MVSESPFQASAGLEVKPRSYKSRRKYIALDEEMKEVREVKLQDIIALIRGKLDLCNQYWVRNIEVGLQTERFERVLSNAEMIINSVKAIREMERVRTLQGVVRVLRKYAVLDAFEVRNLDDYVKDLQDAGNKEDAEVLSKAKKCYTISVWKYPLVCEV